MSKYLDENGLLYLLQDILGKIDSKQDLITISEVINSSSTNTTVAGAKAVYDYVTAALASVTGLTAQIVDTLPQVGQNNILYLVPKTDTGSNDAYDEYMWISSSWEKIGTTEVDLSDYLKTTDISAWAKAPDKPAYTATEVGAAPTNHTHTKSQITDFPTALKNPTALTITLGSTSTAYDGSTAKTVTITPVSIGAAATSHTHTVSQITDLSAMTNDEIDTIITSAGG